MRNWSRRTTSDKILYDLAGISYSDYIVRDILCHYRASPYGDIAAYGDSGQYGHASADPHIVSYSHRFITLPTGVTLDGVRAVACSIYADIRADETVVADSHTSLVENGKVEVCEESFSDSDLLAVIAVKRLIHNDFIISHMSEQVLQNLESAQSLRGFQGIVFVDDFLNFIQLPEQLVIDRRIDHSGEHLFLFSHVLIQVLQLFLKQSP